MKRIIVAAGLLLALQIVLAVALHLGGDDTLQTPPESRLFAFKAEAVTGLTISDDSKGSITLIKGDKGWVLPGTFDAPASAEQVTALLEKLAGLKQGLPVATSAGAATRFKVADDLYQRHVVLREGDKVVADFYIGTSPGFRQIHARKAGSQEVVSVNLSTFELETAADQWLDKKMFAVKEEDIAALVFPTFTLRRNGAEWQMDGLGEGEKTDATAAADLVAKVSGLTVQSVVAAETASPFFTGEPALRFTVQRKDGGELVYTLAKGGEDAYYLQQSQRQHYGRVHKLQAEGLEKAARDGLIVKAAAPGGEAGAAQPAGEVEAGAGSAAPPAAAGAAPAAGEAKAEGAGK